MAVVENCSYRFRDRCPFFLASSFRQFRRRRPRPCCIRGSGFVRSERPPTSPAPPSPVLRRRLRSWWIGGNGVKELEEMLSMAKEFVPQYFASPNPSDGFEKGFFSNGFGLNQMMMGLGDGVLDTRQK